MPKLSPVTDNCPTWNYSMTKSLQKICCQTENRTRNLMNTSQTAHPTDLEGAANALWQIHQNGMCAQRRLRSAWASAQSDQSLRCIRPVWSESSLCAQLVAKDQSFLHTDREDSDQTGRMPRLIWVFAWRTCHFVGFVMWRLIWHRYYNVMVS